MEQVSRLTFRALERRRLLLSTLKKHLCRWARRRHLHRQLQKYQRKKRNRAGNNPLRRFAFVSFFFFWDV